MRLVRRHGKRLESLTFTISSPNADGVTLGGDQYKA